MKIKRGEIVLANLEHVVGSEQGRIRPVLIIQNDDSNEFSPTTIIAPITTKTRIPNAAIMIVLMGKPCALFIDAPLF